MEFWIGRRVLVTGAAGFIGGHLAVALNRAGANVSAFCRYNSRGDRGTLEWFEAEDRDGIECLFGDVRDPDAVDRAVADADLVLHLAAQVAVPHSLRSPRDFVATNVEGTLNLAQAALRRDVGRVVHMSSSEVYGAVTRLPIGPDDPLRPRSPYAASKAAADLLIASFVHAYGLPAVTARAFNTYGPHQSARAVLPSILVQALAGQTLRLGSLEPTRDLLFVEDAVAGLMAIGSCAGGEGEIFHLGTGQGASVGKLVELAGDLLGRELVVETDPQRVRPPESEVPALICDATRTTEATGWRPQVSLSEGMERTLRWLRDNRDRYRPTEYAT